MERARGAATARARLLEAATAVVLEELVGVLELAMARAVEMVETAVARAMAEPEPVLERAALYRRLVDRFEQQRLRLRQESRTW